MNVQLTLLNEIQVAKKWLAVQKEENMYRTDLGKRIELINWVLENMKNPDVHICALIEIRINQLIDQINEKDSIEV